MKWDQIRAGDAMRRLILLLTVGTCSWVVATASEAQTADASLRVTVTDTTGGVLVGARVSVRQSAGPERQAVTGERGEGVITGLLVGPADVRVESDSFEPLTVPARRLRSGPNRMDVRLQIARLAEHVEVKRDAREKQLDPRGDAFARVLTAEHIAQLPDDPEELAAALRQMAGPGALIRVNGFGGGSVPPKSQIRQIRFSLNGSSAETHEMGTAIIEIATRPGTDTWRTNVSFGFRNSALTARYAFAPAASSERLRRVGVSVYGPLWRDHTSLSMNVQSSSSFDSKTILAFLPEGRLSGVVDRPSDRIDFSVRLEHALTKSHTSRLEFERNANTNLNLGVGDFNLPERSYSTGQTNYVVRISDAGSIGKRFFNDVHLQAGWQDQATRSDTQQPAVLVLDAFCRGGAQSDSARTSWELEAAEDLDFTYGRHAFRTGVLIQAGQYRSVDDSNRLGTFTFAGLEMYRAGRPTTYAQRVGQPAVDYGFFRSGSYLQDDVKLHKSLSVGLGVRYEAQAHVDDRLNFSPRAGFTWAPFENGRTTIRGGAGLFYNWFEPSTYEQTLRVDGRRQYDVVVRNPGFPDPLVGGTPIVLPPGRRTFAADLRLPRVAHFSVALQRQVTVTTLAMVTYTRQRGAGLFRGRNLNAPTPAGERPDPLAGNVIETQSTGRSALDRLSILFAYHIIRNERPILLFTTMYGLSRQMNDADGPFSLPADNNHLAADWGPARSDARHRVATMMNVSLPKRLRLTVMASATSALPYNITTGFDDNGDTESNDRPAGVGRNSGRGAPQWDASARLGWSIGFGKSGQAGRPGAGPNSTRSRDEGDPLGGAGSFFDTQGTRYRLEIYVQAYNVFNHVSRVGFSGVRTSPFFGQPTASLPPRRIEIGTRLDF